MQNIKKNVDSETFLSPTSAQDLFILMRPLELGLGAAIFQLKYVVKIFFMAIQIVYIYIYIYDN